MEVRSQGRGKRDEGRTAGETSDGRVDDVVYQLCMYSIGRSRIHSIGPGIVQSLGRESEVKEGKHKELKAKGKEA